MPVVCQILDSEPAVGQSKVKPDLTDFILEVGLTPDWQMVVLVAKIGIGKFTPVAAVGALAGAIVRWDNARARSLRRQDRGGPGRGTFAATRRGPRDGRVAQ